MKGCEFDADHYRARRAVLAARVKCLALFVQALNTTEARAACSCLMRTRP
jgi:hypothetical protein